MSKDWLARHQVRELGLEVGMSCDWDVRKLECIVAGMASGWDVLSFECLLARMSRGWNVMWL